ncbi:DUF3574 domain-containing protein [Falsiroseomonas sp. HW251]|uniref:DUF3574 domain-containing protein n=1 Tax=Falsiroseomonas sp. HW251 TaxID=3390998 RepID=UPI003D318510
MIARALLVLPLLAGCAATGAEMACPAGTQAATVAEAFLGRAVRDRADVSDAEWDAFLREVVTPAFPDGATAHDTLGQWRGADGTVLRERSKLLVLVLPGADAAAAQARLRPVEDAWKRRFNQESVLTSYRTACVGF